MSSRSVADLPLSGQRVFLRADLNVPLRDGAVADDSRIRASLETLEFIRQRGGRAIVASHLGRPRGRVAPEFSLKPVAEALGLPLAPDCVGGEVEAQIDALAEGDALLLENLRFHAGEEANDPGFADQLARLCDVYVNDAFGTAHRAHASTAGLPGRCSKIGAGFLLQREIEALTRVRDEPDRPYVCVLGGAKVSDKLGVLDALSRRADAIAVGGAMAYTFLLAQGREVGRSLVEPERVDVARRLLDGPAELLLPSDHVVAPGPDAPGAAQVVRDIPADQAAFDVGPATVDAIRARLAGAKTVFWNGPLGLFETPPFDAGTRAIAQAIAQSDAYSVVGGGDSLAAVAAAGVGGQISHLSTGGGASLEFIEGRSLPGIAALEDGR